MTDHREPISAASSASPDHRGHGHFDFTSLVFRHPYGDFTAVVHPAARTDDFEPDERRRLRQLIRDADPASPLPDLSDQLFDETMGFVGPDEDRLVRPTVCGLLMQGRSEALACLLPTAVAVFQVLEGTGRATRNDDYRLPIAACFEQILNDFREWNGVPDRDSDSVPGRPHFSEELFAAVLENAFIHREYRSYGFVRVAFDDGGLDVTSTGAFCTGVTAENVSETGPVRRNPCLARAVGLLGLTGVSHCGLAEFTESLRFRDIQAPDFSGSTEAYVRAQLYPVRRVCR